YGMHFTCKPGTAISHHYDVEPQHDCGANLLPALAATLEHCDVRCCDDGTLTGTREERLDTGTLDVRPDFRICGNKTAELDCSAFAGMRGRPANAPRFGAPIDNGI